MPTSVLEAIREGYWDYEPNKTDDSQFDSTRAMPGSKEKLDVMAERIASGPGGQTAPVLDTIIALRRSAQG